MFGFLKKKNTELVKVDTRVPMLVIPEEFYGGKDPVIYYQNQNNKNNKDKPLEKDFVEKKSSGLVTDLFKNKIVLYGVSGIVFLLVVGVITWYYLNQAGYFVKSPAIEPEPSKITTENIVEPIVTTTEEINTSTEPLTVEPVATSTSAITQVRSIEFPGVFLTNSADMDNDSLTDIEEETIGTDSGVWDTDKDGYYDGQEVYNLYNPVGLAPMKIVDSGVVLEYVNPIWQYRLYYPNTWQIGAVDEGGRQVLFSAADGDYFEVDVVDKDVNESFTDWFVKNAVGQKYTDLVDFNNRFKEAGKKRVDDLVAYFVVNNKVYVLTYHSNSSGFASYRHFMQLLIQSFRPNKTTVEIPTQVILNEPGLSTSTINP